MLQVSLYLCHALSYILGPLTYWWLVTSVKEKKKSRKVKRRQTMGPTHVHRKPTSFLNKERIYLVWKRMSISHKMLTPMWLQTRKQYPGFKKNQRNYLQIKDSFQVCVETRGYESAWSKLKTHMVCKELHYFCYCTSKERMLKSHLIA